MRLGSKWLELWRNSFVQIERLAGGLAEVLQVLSAGLDERVFGRQHRAGDAIRSAVTRFGVSGLAHILGDDSEVVQRVGEVRMPAAELLLLEGGRLTQVLLR